MVICIELFFDERFPESFLKNGGGANDKMSLN